MSRILVIDDDQDVRTVVLDMLESAGYEVVVASDGIQGLELQRQHPADVIITDLFMPEKDGIETIHELKREFPDVKIIAMSGGGKAFQHATYLSTASSLGAHLVLHKPFESRTLLDLVQNVLERSTTT